VLLTVLPQSRLQSRSRSPVLEVLTVSFSKGIPDLVPYWGRSLLWEIQKSRAAGGKDAGRLSEGGTSLRVQCRGLSSCVV
jgi:hypothetical protein